MLPTLVVYSNGFPKLSLEFERCRLTYYRKSAFDEIVRESPEWYTAQRYEYAVTPELRLVKYNSDAVSSLAGACSLRHGTTQFDRGYIEDRFGADINQVSFEGGRYLIESGASTIFAYAICCDD